MTECPPEWEQVARKRNNDADTAKGLVALVVGASVFGGFEAARDFVLARLSMFVALVAAVAVLLVLVVGRRVAASRKRQERQRVLDAHVGSTDGMSGPEFERLVARLLQRDGFTDVRIPGGAGDLGADVLARHADGWTLVVQCKRYAQHRGVSSPDIQKFLGTCFHEHGADKAWFVTTSGFSRAARELGTRRGVQLVDRVALAKWMAEGGDASAIRAVRSRFTAA